MPGCKRQLQLVLSHSKNTTSPTSHIVDKLSKSNSPSLREYAVDAFRDNGIDLMCQDIADDQFCTSGIVLQPGTVLLNN